MSKSVSSQRLDNVFVNENRFQPMAGNRIGLVSFSITGSFYLILGEIFDKEVIINNTQELSSDIRFLYPFKAKFKDKKMYLYNKTDFIHFWKKYNMTRIISIKPCSPKSNEIIKFHSPCLFNITNMTPITPIISVNKHVESRVTFDHENKKLAENIDSDGFQPIETLSKIFIVFPYENPVLRGRILDECISRIGKNRYFFILIGKKISTFMKRYLLKNNIDSSCIYKNHCDSFPDSLTESFVIMSTAGYNHESGSKIFIALSINDIREVMCYNMHRKISYLCG